MDIIMRPILRNSTSSGHHIVDSIFENASEYNQFPIERSVVVPVLVGATTLYLLIPPVSNLYRALDKPASTRDE